jgi:hypothetical protein
VELSDKIGQVITSVAEQSMQFLSLRPRAFQIAKHHDNAGGNDVAITSGILL